MKKYQATTTLEILQDAKNYNQWIAETFLPHLKSPVLEIGAGIGNLTKFFATNTPYLVTDYDATLLTQAKKKIGTKKDVEYEQFDITAKPKKPLLSRFSSVIAINVLEHIEDDIKALHNLSLTLKPKGKLLLLVPAKQFAYTRFDKEIGHFRRYEKNELTDKLTQTGFIIEKMFFFNFVGLISWIVRDKVERSDVEMKPYQIAMFDKIVPILKRIETVLPPFVGVSLIVIAKKK